VQGHNLTIVSRVQGHNLTIVSRMFVGQKSVAYRLGHLGNTLVPHVSLVWGYESWSCGQRQGF